MTSSNGTLSALLAFCEGIHRSPVDSSHKDQWRGALIFSLICAWKNGWANDRDAGDLRRHRVNYDVTVMQPWRRNNACFPYMKANTILFVFRLLVISRRSIDPPTPTPTPHPHPHPHPVLPPTPTPCWMGPFIPRGRISTKTISQSECRWISENSNTSYIFFKTIPEVNPDQYEPMNVINH